MIIHLVRALFLLVVLAFSISYGFQQDVYGKGSAHVTAYIVLPVLAAFILVMVDMLWRGKRLQILSGLFFGVLGGLVIAYVLSLIVDLVAIMLPSPLPVKPPGDRPRPPAALTATAPAARDIEEYVAAKKAYQRDKNSYDLTVEEYQEYMFYVRSVQIIKILLGSAAVFFCVSFVLQTKDDFRFVIPYVEFAKETRGPRPILLDTSVIIDGRIADVAETGVIDAEAIVPRFILNELQTIADSEDKLKRNRGRRGLDILNRLQNSKRLAIRILDARVPEVEAAGDVDGKLVAMANHLHGKVVTNDYNLSKVAQLRKVEVININDLANALKPVVLPGENLSVKVIKPGEEAGQGVGYLEDGTMVVAEQARDHVGREVTITVTSVLQTSAGRMIFGRLNGDKTFGRRDKHPG